MKDYMKNAMAIILAAFSTVAFAAVQDHNDDPVNIHHVGDVGFQYELNGSIAAIPAITASGFYRIAAVCDPVKCNNVTLKSSSDVVIAKIP